MVQSNIKTATTHQDQHELTPKVRHGVSLMALAVKNFMLYPETNTIRSQSLENFYLWLKQYLDETEVLRLTVEKDRLMFYKDVVHQDKPDEQALAAPLFRDSIQWFEFHENLEREELETFITLLCRFRSLKDEASDDLATCLWEAGFQHIKHKTADKFWEIDPLLEINALKNIIESNDDPASAAEISAHIEAGSKTVGMVLEAFNRVEKKYRPAPSGGESAAGLVPGQGGTAGERVDLEGEGSSAGDGGPPPDIPNPFERGEVSAPGGGGVPGGIPGGVGGAAPGVMGVSIPGAGRGAAGRPDEAGTQDGGGVEKVYGGPVGLSGPAGLAGPVAGGGDGDEEPGASAPPDRAAASAWVDDGVSQEMTPSFSALLSTLENNPPTRVKQELAGALALEGSSKTRRSNNPLTYVDLSDSRRGQSDRRDSNPFDLDDEEATSTDMAMAEAMFKVSTYFDTQGTSPFWKLTPVEQRHLRSLIAIEERRNNTGDCLAIVKIMLNSLASNEERLGVVDFIAEEAKYAIGAGDVSFFQAFIEQLHRESAAGAGHNGGEDNWVHGFLFELNRKLSSEDVLNILAEPMDVKLLTDSYLSELRNFLLLLPPEALFALIPLLPKVQDQKLGKTLLQVVALRASQVQGNIAPVINNLKTSLVVELINIIKTSQLPISASFLMGLTRNESHHVRREAAQLLLEANPDYIKQLFHLVDDPHLDVNSLICTKMSQARSPLSERILMDYLRDNFEQPHRGRGKAHTLNCYRALGLCGSSSSIFFLQDVLMRKNWKTFLGLEGNWHGVGAAMALMLMPEEWGTKDILQKAAQSHFRNIRQAYGLAVDELPLGWKLDDNDQ